MFVPNVGKIFPKSAFLDKNAKILLHSNALATTLLQFFLYYGPQGPLFIISMVMSILPLYHGNHYEVNSSALNALTTSS